MYYFPPKCLDLAKGSQTFLVQIMEAGKMLYSFHLEKFTGRLVEEQLSV
jgi:hypothetical protein